MSPPAQPADRREPMPGLFALPGHLLRQLPPPWRRVAIGALVALLVGCVVAAVVLGPQISESNRERAAEQRRAERQAAAERLARLRAERRPRTGHAEGVAGVEAAITRDARARARTGEFDNPAIRTDCRTLTRRGGRLLLACTAVTSDFEGNDEVRGVLIGYPYRAALTLADGSYGLCKTSGRPGEGALERREQIELPRACGG
jgi:hypothetical protein